MSALVAIEAVLPASPERVFWAWTDPDGLCGWLCERAHREADRIVLEWPSLAQAIQLNVDSLVPGRSLRLVAVPDPAGGESEQELSFEAHPAGTQLTLRHRVAPSIAQGTENGWWLRLYLLRHFLERGHRRMHETLAASVTGDAGAIFAAVREAATRWGLGPFDVERGPDVLAGAFGDAVFAIRRFPLVASAHLLAAQAMRWGSEGDTLSLKERLLSVLEEVTAGGRHRHCAE